MLELNGITVVITGAGSGFGHELAFYCANDGMQLAQAAVERFGNIHPLFNNAGVKTDPHILHNPVPPNPMP
ncbi:MAG: hypothetical protein JWM42_3604 [Burkholderia sp.]|nr:hypothetical protein [Burkholderia sp.]